MKDTKKKFVLIGVFFGFIVVLALSLLLSQTNKERALHNSFYNREQLFSGWKHV